ncbi:MAG: tetratricopeptide repeat protein [bacterium]
MTNSLARPEAPLPVPPSGERPYQKLEWLIGDAIAHHDVAAILERVRRFAEDYPPPDRPLLAAQPGLTTVADPANGARPLKPQHYGNWYHMVLYNAGNACLRAEEPALALTIYLEALRGCAHASLFNNIASCHAQLGDPVTALVWYRKALVRDRDYLVAHLRIAALIIRAELPDEDPLAALEAYGAAGGTPGDVNAYLERLEPEERAQIGPVFEEFFEWE